MFLQISHRLIKVLVLFSLLVSTSIGAYASDYYWVGGSGDWNNPAHWSLSSGGAGGAGVPTSSDDVIFDDYSFAEIYPVIQFSSDISVQRFEMISNTYPSFVSLSHSITIKDELLLMKKAAFVTDGAIIFDADSDLGHEIHTNSIDFGADIIFNGGNWALKGHLKTKRDRSIQLNGGYLKTNDYTIHAKDILATSGDVILNLGSSHLLAVDVLDLSAATEDGEGTVVMFIADGATSIVDKGDWGDAIMKDATVACPNPPFTLSTFITSDYNGAAISCPDSCDLEITVTPGGTPGPFSYELDGSGVFTDITVYTGLCQGTHDWIVIDSSNEIAPGVFDQCLISDGALEPGTLTIGAPIPISNSCPDSCDAQAFTFPGGGTAPYTLFWPISGETTPNPVGLCDGFNVVQMLDVNNCPHTDSVEITGPPAIVADFTVTPPTCNGGCDGEVDANPSGGNGFSPGTVFWSTVPTSGQGTDPGIGFCAGTLTLTVTDDDGCPKDTLVVIPDPPPINVVLDGFTDAICNGDCTGTADITVTGGTPAYTFEWVDDATLTIISTDEDPTNLCAGDYTLTVTDDNGCTQTLTGITIDEPPAFILNQDAYGTSCFGVCDGAVDVDASGGTPGYLFSWETFPGGVGIGATDSISGLCPGFYQITITDANGCDSTMTEIEVIEPPELSLTVSFTDPSCYDVCDGTATALPAGGTLPYTFTWSPLPPVDGTTATPSGMCEGTYDLLLTDDNGCSTTESVTLTNPDEYDISSTVTDILCNGDADGAIDITVNAGGDGGPYTFTWAPAPPIGDGTANVSGLTAGVWSVTISDGNACDTTLTFTIDEPPLLTVNANLISDASCSGDCDGSVSVTIGGGTPAYNILWDDPGASTGTVVGGLCAGTYTVIVTDDNGCVNTDDVTVAAPVAFTLDSSQVNNLCPGDCLGTATVNVLAGGTAPYSIQWDDPLLQTTPTAINLCAGVYNATVTDANLCDTVITFTITEPAPFVIDTNVISSACFGTCSGEANVVVAGGTPGYNFEWFDAGTGLSMGVFVDNINGLCPGDYYCAITDANGCTELSDTLTITELPEIITSLVSSTDATCGLCDGVAEVLATGGAGGFSYDWTPDPGTGDGTPSVTGLCDGVYSVDIVDDAGCTASMSVTINSLAIEVMDMDSTDVICFGDCDGTVTASWGSLDAPYTLEWFDEGTGLAIGAPITPADPLGETLIGQCAGTYIALLTNATGCVTSDTISINEPTEIIGTITPTDVSCNGVCDGSALIVVSGGVPGYDFNWIPLPGGGQGTDNAIGLCAGIWDVEVTDASGCTVTFSTTINEPIGLIIDLETSTDITCFGDNDGTATVSVSGGTAPLSFEWFDCATGLPIGQTTSTATGLPPGDYECVITDDNGCTITSSCLPVLEPDEITAIVNIQQVSCFGDCDGMIDVVAAGGAGTYFYQWQDAGGVPLVGQTNDTILGLCQDFYNLEITDINGCTATFGPFDLTPPADAWDVTTSQTNITCSGSCDGIAGVIVNAGNNPPYTYQWDDPLLQTTPTATNLCAGVVNITISDAGVCDTTITFTITDDNPIFANALITDVPCNGDCNGEITVTPSGGTGPYTVTWSDLQVGNTATGLCAGAITCTITDGNGCVKDTTINISEPLLPLSASTTFSNPAACGVCNGSATVNMTPGSGTAPYTFDWDPDPTSGDGTNNALGLCPGVVTCTITDDNGCVLVETFAISDISGEDLTMSSTDASCFGVCDGTAEVTYVCSDPGCTNEWFDGGTGLALSPPETGTTISGLCAGDFYVEVINASGCVSVDFVTISSPTQIIANEVITPVTCNGDSDGAIDLAPTGGSGAGYTYVWTPAPPIGDGTANVSGLTAGTWCVDITDSDGCTESVCFDLIDPDPILITPTATDVSCNGSCDGIISVIVSGGGGGYSFQWLDGGGGPIAGETGPTITNLCPGNYSVEVTDINGCTVVLSPVVTIAEPIAISGPVTFTDVTCFGDCDGTVTVTPAGGLPPYTIQWFDSGGLIGATSTTVTGLCPEDYFAVIQDANGCNFTTATVSITEPPELTATVTFNDASCNGFCDGDAEVFPVGGTPAYTFEWLDIGGVPVVGGTAAAVSNLCAGNYTVEVSDLNGCSTGTIPVVIDEFDAITATIFTNDATCGVNDGNATVFADGGNPPLLYQWFDDTFTPLAGENNNVLLDQFAGTYFVEVTDANGCTEVFEANISNVSTTNLVWDAVNHPLCPGDANGSLEVTVTGANPPFTYEWDPGGSVAEDPAGLEAGTYTIEITDALGCINFYDTTLVDPDPIIVTTNSITPTDCGQCNGEIDVSVSGGTGALSTLWNNGETSTTITGLCSGIYEIIVTDENGCETNEPISVDNNEGLTASDLVTAISCAGSCDGAVTVSGVDGTPPYSFFWLHDGSTSATLTGLCAGTYFCEVTDDAGCTYTIEVPMLDPNPITATDNINNPACGATDGSITVLTDGGVLPHTYLWSTGDPTNSISGLDAGIYTLTVTDATGCSADFVYGISNESAPTAELTSTDVNCFGDCDGTVDTLSQTGGTAAFTYQWLDADGLAIAGETNPLYSDVCIGDYLLEITDAAGCISYQSISVEGPDTIATNPLFATDPTCFGDCDGSIVSNPFGGTLPFTFSWDDPSAQATASATGLCDGTYTVVITDANGCIVDQTATLIEPPEITITVDSTVAATCLNSPDGEIYVTVAGGVEPLDFEYVTETLTDTFTVEDPTGLLPMTYYLTVTDANGCQAFDTIDIDTTLIVLAFAGNDSLVCFNDSLCVVGTSNIPSGATFSWSDTSGTLVSSDSLLCLFGNPSGATDYVLTVDFNGCAHTDTVLLTVNDSLYVEAGEDLQLFSTESGQLGGSPTSVFDGDTVAWTPPTYLDATDVDNPNIIQPQESGWYYVELIDSNGCRATDSVYVEVLPDIVIPDGISPNGDGLNDTWILDIIAQLNNSYPGVEVFIGVYNRWGDELYTSDENYANDWDGTREKDGQRLPAGTYYYVIDVSHPTIDLPEKFDEPFTGPITVMW